MVASRIVKTTLGGTVMVKPGFILAVCSNPAHKRRHRTLPFEVSWIRISFPEMGIF